MKRSGIARRSGTRSQPQRLNRLRKKRFGSRFERSEEFLRIQNERLRGILRAKPALRMTVFSFFPQTIKPSSRGFRFGRTEGSTTLNIRVCPSEESRDPARGATNFGNHSAESEVLHTSYENRTGKSACATEAHIQRQGSSPLKISDSMVPPLPRWATVFRPWRDWRGDGCF